LDYHATDGERVFVVYVARTKTGKRFRNCETHMVRPARSLGWNLPHGVAKGQHK
jgi:hypothetical protein